MKCKHGEMALISTHSTVCSQERIAYSTDTRNSFSEQKKSSHKAVPGTGSLLFFQLNISSGKKFSSSPPGLYQRLPPALMDYVYEKLLTFFVSHFVFRV